MLSMHPATSLAFKRWLIGQSDRDPPTRRWDVLQADAVRKILAEYLPQM